MKLKLTLIIINICLTVVVFSQEVTPEVTADPSTFEDLNIGVTEINAYLETDVVETTLGMPFTVKLVVEMPDGYSIVDGYQDIFKDPFQIVDSGEIQTRQQGNRQILEQDLQIVAWQLDYLTSSELFIVYLTPAGEQFRTPIASITVNVTSTRVESDITLRPATPLVDLPYTPPYLFAIPVVIIIILILIFRNIQFNRRVQQALAAPDSAVQRAVVELKHLLETNATIEEIYPIIADAIREYLTDQFHIRAVDMTTVELMSALQANPVFSDSLRSSLNDLLEQADLVKFASHRPVTPPETAVEYAVRWIEQAERARIAHE